MKTLKNIFKSLLVLGSLVTTQSLLAQDDSTKPEVSVNLRYFNDNNSLQYLLLETKIKKDGRFQPLEKQAAEVYLDSNAAENLVGKAVTDAAGKAKLVLTPNLKTQWDASSTHKFIVVTPATAQQEATENEFSVTKAKISIDTTNSDGTRSVTAQVMKFENGEWVAVKDVEVKIGIKRLGSYLQIGEEESYTTDSLGQVSGEFKRDSMPGDAKGMITLVARVEDNEELGNLITTTTVPWGKYYAYSNNFGQRSLWATRHRAPLWLLFMAYSIIGAVWGVIVYLVFQIIKIRKLGKEVTVSSPRETAVLQD